MSTTPSSSVSLISGDGIAPDTDTLGIDAGSGKMKIVRVPVDALPAEVLGDGLELTDQGFEVKIDEAPDGVDYTTLEKSPSGMAIKGDANGAGRRYVGTDHTEVAAPNPGDIYYEIGPEV